MDAMRVVDERWDYLIILDACRYDYFEQVYGRYLQGRLTKKISPGSSTNEWRDKSFPGRYDDIVYISANPQFSQTAQVYGFCAGDHFHKVHEIWKAGWDRGTVRPETVTAAAPGIIARTPGKRFIIHYMQPHAPYLSLGEDARGYINADINTPRTLVGEGEPRNVPRTKAIVFGILMALFRWNRLLGNHPDWLLRRFLKMPPRAPMEIVLRAYSIQQLRQAYMTNLERVLEQAAQLIKYLSGVIVVTADHGELLGEDKCFSHPTGASDAILLEVPWLVIEKDRPSAEINRGMQTPASDVPKGRPKKVEGEDEQLAQKLRALGYY